MPCLDAGELRAGHVEPAQRCRPVARITRVVLARQRARAPRCCSSRPVRSLDAERPSMRRSRGRARRAADGRSGCRCAARRRARARPRRSSPGGRASASVAGRREARGPAADDRDLQALRRRSPCADARPGVIGDPALEAADVDRAVVLARGCSPPCRAPGRRGRRRPASGVVLARGSRALRRSPSCASACTKPTTSLPAGHQALHGASDLDVARPLACSRCRCGCPSVGAAHVLGQRHDRRGRAAARMSCFAGGLDALRLAPDARSRRPRAPQRGCERSPSAR